MNGALAGELRRRVALDDKSGFFEKLGLGINRLMDNLAGLVTRVQGAAVEVSRGADEISQGNSHLSQRTEEQASSLEETAASMEQMTSTVRQNAENAGQANQLAVAATRGKRPRVDRWSRGPCSRWARSTPHRAASWTSSG